MENPASELFNAYMAEMPDMTMTEKALCNLIAYYKSVKGDNTRDTKGDTKNESRFDQLDKLNIQETVKMFHDIGNIARIEFDIVVNDGKTQRLEKCTIMRMLSLIRQNDVHTIVEKNKTYKCGYHVESLFEHLHYAMINTVAYLPTDMIYKQKLYYGFTALIHDIGKQESYQKIEKNKSNLTPSLSYNFHGEMGAGLILQMYNDNFAKHFSLEEWEDMARTICVHMCGYHETNPKSIVNQYKWSLLRLENSSVKTALHYLSFGDLLGSVRNAELRAYENLEQLVSSRKAFAEFIVQDFDAKTFFKNHGIYHMMIAVRGGSASGKSRMALTIVNALAEQKIPYRYINRDDILCRTTARYNDITIADDHKITGDEYNKYRAMYDVQKDVLPGLVNTDIQNRISDGFYCNEIVILDTMVTMFGAFEHLCPPTTKYAFIMAIDVIRGELVTSLDAERLGCSLNKQIELHGKRSIFKWMSSDGNSKNLTSLSTANNMMKIEEMSRPRLVHVTAWNLCKQEQKTDSTSVEQKVNVRGYSEFLRQMMLLCAPFASMDRKEKIADDDNDIIKYVNHQFQLYGWSTTLESFRKMGFDTITPQEFKDTPFAERVITIKYREYCKIWKPKWARQCRGIVLFLDDVNKIVSLKYLLMRGAEVLTGLHVKRGIENTQDCKIRDFDFLDTEQQKTIACLTQGGKMNATLTFKSDGSLLGVSMYAGELGKIVRGWIIAYGDDFAKAVLRVSEEEKASFVPIIASQKTFFLMRDMQDYMTTSMLCGSSAISHSDLCGFAKSATSAQAFDKFGGEFMRRLDAFYRSYNEQKHNVVTLSMEATCQDRTSAWGERHTELTVSYNKSGLKVLGVSHGHDNIMYLPHFAISDHIKKMQLEEPMYWRVQSATQIENMMIYLTKCIRGEIKEGEFLKIHAPQNINGITDFSFDYEGFVMYNENLSYSKIKLTEYYKTHKFKPENIEYIMELAKTASHIFPTCNNVQQFFGQLDKLLLNVCHAIVIELKDAKENKLYVGLNEGAKRSYNNEKTTFDVRCRMLANSRSETWYSIARTVFIKVFPLLETSRAMEKKETIMELNSCLLGIVMTLTPWNEEGLKGRIENMIKDHHKCLATLFGYLQSQKKKPTSDDDS